MRQLGKRGFTLVEVVVAFAVLAIVAGTLLDIFVTATKVNQNSYEVDKAHALAVRQIELFKSVPSSVGVTTTYFDQSWNSGPGIDDTNNVYTMVQTVSGAAATVEGQMSYYADVVDTIVAAPGIDLTVTTINPSAPDASTLNINSNALTADDYLKVKNKRIAVLIKATQPLTLTVLNTAKLTMTGGKYNAAGTSEAFELAVYISGITEAQLNLKDCQGTFSTSIVNDVAVGTTNRNVDVRIIKDATATALEKELVHVDGSKYNVVTQ